MRSYSCCYRYLFKLLYSVEYLKCDSASSWLIDAGLLYVGAITYAIALASALALAQPLLSALQIIELPTVMMKLAIVALILLDALLCLFWETALRKLFGVGIAVLAA